jgi:hypothetical protein
MPCWDSTSCPSRELTWCGTCRNTAVLRPVHESAPALIYSCSWWASSRSGAFESPTIMLGKKIAPFHTHSYVWGVESPTPGAGKNAPSESYVDGSKPKAQLGF